MNKLKFRIWNPVLAKMVFFDQNASSDPVTIQLHNFLHLFQVSGLDSDLSHFTGLVDRFGNDVYDGDIVWVCVSSLVDNKLAIKHKMKNLSVVGWSRNKLLWEAVAINKGTFGHTVHHLSEYVQPSTLQIEVVGNIYQNPELKTYNEHNVETVE